MKKVPNNTFSERTPVLPFRDEIESEATEQNDNQLRQDKAVQWTKSRAPKVKLSSRTAAERANILASVLLDQVPA